jgi:hypothetical protein
MISAEEKLQVENYLIWKKLPLDILLEVKDHMISQIEDCMNDERIGFEEAFSRVELSWRGSFSLTKYWVFYGNEKIPLIVKKIIKEKYYQIFKKAFVFALVSFFISILLVFYADNVEQYKTFFHLQNALFVGAPSIILVLNYKLLKYMRADFKFKGRIFYTMYQKNVGLLAISTISMVQVAMKEGKYAYWFFRTDDHTHTFYTLLTFIVPLFVQSFVIFGIMNFFEHKKKLKDITAIANY